MPKRFACALTHVRHEGFFLEHWIAHYGAIVGRENLFVAIDGDDWTPQVDLTGVNVELMLGAPRRRIENDRWIAREMSVRANALRKRYDHVIRGDVDEYVTIDPDSGLSWETAFFELGDQGYIFALGVDMVQAAGETAPISAAGPVIGARRTGFIADRYTKPFVISRWNNWSGGAHRLLNRPVRISNHFVLFHLALADRVVAEDRLRARGGTQQHASFVHHQQGRLNAIAETHAPIPWDEARAIALRDFVVERDGLPAKRPRASTDPRSVEHGLPVIVPERFAGLA